MDEAILNSSCDFTIQFIHPSLNTPPIFIYNSFLCMRPYFIFSSPNSPYERSANTGPVIYTPVYMPSILYPPESNPLLQRVWLMENRLAGGRGCIYAATVARIESTMAKGRQLHIAVTIPHPPQPPTSSHQRGWRKKSSVSCGVLQAQKKINKGRKNSGYELKSDLKWSNIIIIVQSLENF